MDEQQEPITTWVKKGRIKARMTQEQLAFELEVSTITINKWEKGRCHPRIGNIYAMTRIFGKRFTIG